MKKEQKKYGIMAAVMVLLIMGSLLWIEHRAEANVLGFFIFGFVCSVVLLFSLIKLNVMEFQPGSFWDRLSQRLNQAEDEPAVSQKKRCTRDAGMSNFSNPSYRNAA